MDVYEYFVVFIHCLRFNDLSYKDFIICDLPTIPVKNFSFWSHFTQNFNCIILITYQNVVKACCTAVLLNVLVTLGL